MLVDSHCHLDFPDFASELDGVVKRARDAGIGRIVTICTRVRKFPQVLAVAEKFPEVFCSVGTHPHNAHEELDINSKALIALTKNPKVVAIGEAGLDYHYDNSPREAQAQSLRQHIAAARETGLPLVIHSRDCDADMAKIRKACATSHANCRPTAFWSKPMRRISRRCRIAANATSRLLWRKPLKF